MVSPVPVGTEDDIPAVRRPGGIFVKPVIRGESPQMTTIRIYGKDIPAGIAVPGEHDLISAGPVRGRVVFALKSVVPYPGISQSLFPFLPVL